MIHPTAIIHPRAQLDSTVEVGPFTIIDEHAKIGANTKVGAHSWLTGWLEIGPENRIGYGVVLGAEPQDSHFKDARSYLRIGKGNLFREYCTIHRGSQEDSATTIGNDNFFMGHSHAAHNCVIANKVILANGALLAGHVEIEDGAFISGNCVVHQFVRIGTLALLPGGARVNKNVPPYMMVYHTNDIGAINVIGLRRAQFSKETRQKIRDAYRILFRSGLNTSQAVVVLKKIEHDPAIEHLIQFIETSKRGICRGSERESGEEE
ncbi:MAG: acyl-ACP--UDP-N-acetylglucosamine O-acyltransferase [Verrucomicrobiae bacterium]|nr:acyl-ACP--UDP-N-acetylglucosamine O-acyltransferase [Verrucomicrobiae bacterium]